MSESTEQNTSDGVVDQATGVFGQDIEGGAEQPAEAFGTSEETNETFHSSADLGSRSPADDEGGEAPESD